MLAPRHRPAWDVHPSHASCPSVPVINVARFAHHQSTGFPAWPCLSLKPGLDGSQSQTSVVKWAPSLRQLVCTCNEGPEFRPLAVRSRGCKAVTFVLLLKEGRCSSGQERTNIARTTPGSGLWSTEGFCGILHRSSGPLQPHPMGANQWTGPRR